MLRKVGLASALLLAIPAFANAWTITAKIGSGQGTVVSGTKTIAKPVAAPATSYVGYFKVANEPLVADQTFTVDPATGFSLKSVIVNGLDVTASGVAATGDAKTFTIAAGTPIKNSQSLVVYFTADLFSVGVTQSAGGKITVQRCNAAGTEVYGSATLGTLANLKPGTYVKVTAMPNADYKVASIDGTDVTGALQGDIKSKVIQLGTASEAVDAVFTQVVSVTPALVVTPAIVAPGNKATVDATGTVTNKAGATIAYAFSATDLNGAPVTATFGELTPAVVGKKTVSFPVAGDYKVVVTATVDGVPAVKSWPIKVQVNNVCLTCHSNRNPQLAQDFIGGHHGGATGHTTGTCQRCHATEGAIAGFAVGFTGSYTNVLNATAAKLAWGSVAPVESSNGISCTVCHAPDPHNYAAGTNSLRSVKTYDGFAAITWDPNQNSKNDQYDLCTGCHTLTDNTGAVTDMYHEGYAVNVTRIIADSHFDNPATVGATVGTTLGLVEGYVIRKNSANPCADCHNVHSAGVEIQEAWAGSAHAGKIAAKKDTAANAAAVTWFNATYTSATATFPNGETFPVTSATTSAKVGTSTRTVLEFYQRNAAGVAGYKAVGATDDAEGNAWTHYDWDKTLKPGTGAAAGTMVDDRAACQHCHTATGAANYLKAAAAGTVYDAKKNDFSHLSGWTNSTGSAQQELLYCWGCHADAQTGALHTTGPITLDYKVGGLTTTVTAKDGKSAACISCHTGRGNVDALLGTATMNPLGAGISNPGTKSHYLAAGLTINQAAVKAGYTFGRPTADYADPVYFKHKNLGCAECHMTGPESHSFEVVGKDAVGAITSIKSAKCVECHSGAHGYALTNADLTNANGTFTVAGAAAFLEEEAEGYHQALELLKAALEAKGLAVTGNYPYISGTFANQGVSGAAYNYSYLHHEPGAYAHNRFLAKRLIFDSLDWLNDYQVNNNVVLPATATHARAWFAAAADGSVVRP